MKLHFIHFTIFLILTSSLPAQVDSLWSRCYGGNQSEEEAFSLVQTGDGGFALAGDFRSWQWNEEIYSFHLVRVDENGTLLWSRTYGEVERDEECRGLVATRDGGFALAGWMISPRGDADFLLVRVNGQGEPLWTRTYGGEGNDYCHSLIQTADGGFLLAGVLNGDMDNIFIGDFYLVRTDAQGNQVWAKTYRGPYLDWAFSITPTSDGGFALGGVTGGPGTYGNFWLVKINQNGDSLWSRDFGGADDEICFDLVQTSDGGFALAGIIEYQEREDTDFYLVRTDSEGNLMWARAYGGESDEFLGSIITTPDGGFMIAGETESQGAGGSDIWLLRVDREGRPLWSRTFGGRDNESCEGNSSLIPTRDGGFAIAGWTRSFSQPGPGGMQGNDFWLIKTGRDPVSVSRIEPIVPSNFITLNSPYPNPFNEHSLITFKLSHIAPVRLGIYDLAGHELMNLVNGRYSEGEHTILFNGQTLPAGLYWVKLTSGSLQEVKKLVLVK